MTTLHKMNLIHYGHTEYFPEKVEPIKNYPFVKPIGGVWCSPVGSKWGWKQLCKSIGLCINLSKSFRLKLKPDAKVFVIDSVEDLNKAPLVLHETGNIKKYYLDFEFLSKEYDCIWLTYKGQSETHNVFLPVNLYGWDCESVLIMNPFCCNSF